MEGRRQVSESDGGHPPAGGSRQGQSEGRQADGRQSKPASDPVADLQRWLMRAGARSMANQVADNVRRTLGQQNRDSRGGDIWDTATTEPSPDEPPECQWCPVCQAARRLRDSGPGLGAKLADAGGVLATVVQDAFSAVDQIMKTQNPSSERPVATPPATTPGNGADDHPRDSAQHESGASQENGP
jgi:hypothetical protein